MYKVEVKLKVVTPLYMFGADQNYHEVRASEFKGLMRFWWRALKCCDDIGILKVEELEIFGGVSDKSGKSQVCIVVKHENRNENTGSDLTKDYGLKWHFNEGKRILEGKDRGTGYLFYSMVQKNEKRNILPKKYLKPDATFTIILYSKKEEALKKALAALWCAVNLGGFGSRARRGAGSLTAVEVFGSTWGLDFIPKGRTSEELAQWILKNTRKAADIIQPTSADCSRYSSLASSSLIVSRESYATWHEALSSIGEIYMLFRHGRRNDINSSIFGLPVVHSNRDRVLGKIDKNDEGEYRNKKINRRSSPISFKVIECGGRYYWTALRFGGNFLPKSSVFVLVGPDGKNKKAEKISWSLLDEFWNEVLARNGGSYHFDLRGEAL